MDFSMNFDFNEITNEHKRRFKTLLLTKCSQIVNFYLENEKFLYYGQDKSYPEDEEIIKIKDKNKLKKTEFDINSQFLFSNCLVCRGTEKSAKDYGYIMILFPYDDFIYKYSNIYEFDDIDENNFEDFLLSLQTTNLLDAINNDREIFILCKKFYMASISIFPTFIDFKNFIEGEY